MNLGKFLYDLVLDDPDKRIAIIDTVDEYLERRAEYYIQLVFATIIAVLGLLTDSTAVVIGAMLIAPLFWPTIGFALGILTTRQRLLGKSVYLLGVSVVIVLFIGSVLTILLPLDQVTSEISARTNPTIIDLVIALASSIIGVIAVYNPRVSSSAAGVAVSISLLPPLATSGIGLAFGSFDIVFKALLLFGANIGAIVFSGIIMLYLLKFRPHYSTEKKRWKLGLIMSTIFMFLIAIPLSIFLSSSLEQARVSEVIKKTVNQELSKVDEDTVVDSIDIRFHENEIQVRTTVYLPEDIFLTVEQKNALVDKISDKADASINLQLNVVSTVYLRRQEDTKEPELRRRIINYLTDQLLEIDPNLEIEDINVIFPQAEGSALEVDILLREAQQPRITFEVKQNLEQKLVTFTSVETKLVIDFVPITRLVPKIEEIDSKVLLESVLKEELSKINEAIVLNSFVVTKENSKRVEIEAYIFVPNNRLIGEKKIQKLEQALESELEGQKVGLKLRMISFE